MKEQQRTTCVFAMALSNVTFVETKEGKIVVNKTVVSFDDRVLQVGLKTNELLCVGKDGKNPVKIQFVAKEGATSSRSGRTRPS